MSGVDSIPIPSYLEEIASHLGEEGGGPGLINTFQQLTHQRDEAYRMLEHKRKSIEVHEKATVVAGIAKAALQLANKRKEEELESLQERLQLEKANHENTKALLAGEKEKLLCKVCFESEISIIFTECGHLVCCSGCWIKLNPCACPICHGEGHCQRMFWS